ncbi:ead/Ea22-like family protein [Klebsiella pneumoniae]
MTTDITELAQSLKRRAASANEFGEGLFFIKADDVLALLEALEKAQTINAAAEKLVRCKGRYHSELNYRALAALFGVNTPDLPPLEHENVHYADAAEMEIAALRQRIAELESRAVTVKLPTTRLWAGVTECYEKSDVIAAIRAAGVEVSDD